MPGRVAHHVLKSSHITLSWGRSGGFGPIGTPPTAPADLWTPSPRLPRGFAS